MKKLTTREWIAAGLGVVAAIILFFGGNIWAFITGASGNNSQQTNTANQDDSSAQAVTATSSETSATSTSSGTSTTTIATSSTAVVKSVTSKTKTTMQNISKTQGLEIYDEVVGTGATASAGQKIQAHYVGTLLNGNKFDSSVDRGQPFEFTLGVGQVIQGWDLGIQGMKVGGKRKLVISPELGYGARGAGKLIPPNSTLVFEVQLVAVK